jgi:phospholipase D1/2
LTIFKLPLFQTNLLGVSALSFIKDLGKSYIEGYLSKRSGDNIYYGNCSQLKICCDRIKILHLKRWFCIKESFITYLNPNKGDELCFPMLVDVDFQIKKGIRAGALHSISIKNSQRSLVIKCKNDAQQIEWYENIKLMSETDASVFCTKQRYSSFAPVRKNQICKWYVNAASYMEDVLLALSVAKEEIFITDWWLCPEIFLKRPSEDLQYRLDKILLKKSVNHKNFSFIKFNIFFSIFYK